MSIGGVGSSNSYLYENLNRSNSQKKGTALFDPAGITAAPNSRGVSEQSCRFSANDAYNSMKVKRHEGNGSWLLMSGDGQQLDKLQELADLYKEKYPNLVKSDGLAMGLAEAEAAGHLVRTENGFMMIACNGIQYMDDNDQSKGWGFMYSENDADLYNEIMQAIKEGSIKGGIESVSGWEEWFQEKGHTYERIFSDEELAVMVNGKEIRNGADFRIYQMPRNNAHTAY
ncbi:MAG: hypothetical protein HDR30_05665 [Lachnospiraceae bacterium]|nr:hypothetical protein [Lachnospiraceae bacterium]